ncbi:flagellar hook-associated protein FlgL [Sinimarinibacterium sp. NLF-5-8]|uniref:flagellar hook-associated protein FlgL n=1 Tax=Sinimarinibacterium sp. NLF-5-8 TaxID=2698684 RepID=UPI00137BD0CC|nr:flagellar hook-associated protein FlgL [Sinimarinibacterium sp. NLF-5-8]QHS10008.1 flagellar hook-associated protein 3 [Sinimarinibacterium sp. NLF-5-8]
MMMRVSTALMHQNGVGLMQQQMQSLLKTQTQLSSQQKMQSAADAPSDWSAAMGVDQALEQNQRYQANASSAQHRLGLQENAMADGINVLARVRTLVIQLNTGTQSAESRSAIGVELAGLRDQLLSIGNRDDGKGRFLFGGTQDDVQPFAYDPNNAPALAYAGNNDTMDLPIDSSRIIALGQPGQPVFAPAGGDDDVVSLIDRFVAMANSGSAPIDQADFSDALSQLGRAESRFSNTRASVGLRLGVVQDAQDSLSQQNISAQATLSDLRDVDVAEAASRLQRELMSLQAAQSSFAQIQRLSLFDFIR